METGFVNWDMDWNNCFVIQPGRTKMRWCSACGEFHDKACFFRRRGSWMGCMLDIGSRGKAMAKIKGGAKAGGR